MIVATAAFAIAGAFAGVAGVLIGPITYSNPYLGDTYGIAGFVALMIGGMARPAAAMAGGLLLGDAGRSGEQADRPAGSRLVPIRRGRRDAARPAGGPPLARGIRWRRLRGPLAGGSDRVDRCLPRPRRSGVRRRSPRARRVRASSHTGRRTARLYIQGLVLVAAVFGMLAVSLDLVAGMTGLYSLGHAGTVRARRLRDDHPLQRPPLEPLPDPAGLPARRRRGRPRARSRLTPRQRALLRDHDLRVHARLTVFASDSTFTGGYGGLIGPHLPGVSLLALVAGQSVIWACLIALLVTTLSPRDAQVAPVPGAARHPRRRAVRGVGGSPTSAVQHRRVRAVGCDRRRAGWMFSFQGIVSPESVQLAGVGEHPRRW